MSRLAALLVALAWPAVSSGLELPPAPTGRVNDYAGALDAAARARLESQLKGYEQGTTRQIAVAIFKALDGESLEDFSIRLAEKWKIGGKTQNDGVLLTVFLDDHKPRIEVGYGVEDKLTDARSAQIIRDEIAPRFRAGKIEEGLAAGLAAIDTTITGRDHAADMPAPLAQPAGRGSPSGWPLILLGVVVLMLFFGGGRRFLFGMLVGGWLGGSGGWSSRSGGSWGGGGGGGFSGGGGSFGGGGASGSW